MTTTVVVGRPGTSVMGWPRNVPLELAASTSTVTLASTVCATDGLAVTMLAVTVMEPADMVRLMSEEVTPPPAAAAKFAL